MMKVAALYCVSGVSRWLPFSYRSIYPAVDGVYFLISDTTWHGKRVDNSSVIQQIRALEDPQGKVSLFEGSWNEETLQRNFSLAYAQMGNFTHALIIDADEIYHTRQLIDGLKYAVTRPDVECFHVKWFTYWKNPEWRIDPVEPYDPPVLLKLGAGGFVETRNVVTKSHALLPPEIIMCHHLSYVLTDDELKQKHIFEPGHSQTCRPEWYEKVWKAWDSNPNLENLHPVNGEWFKRAVRQPLELLPDVLRGAASRI